MSLMLTPNRDLFMYLLILGYIQFLSSRKTQELYIIPSLMISYIRMSFLPLPCCPNTSVTYLIKWRSVYRDRMGCVLLFKIYVDYSQWIISRLTFFVIFISFHRNNVIPSLPKIFISPFHHYFLWLFKMV